MRRTPVLFALGSAVALVLAACGGGGGKPEAYPLDDRLRVNEIQLLNSHNSYHLRPTMPLPDFLYKPVDYAHPPLDEQLEDQGIRGFELDVFNGPGGLPVAHTPVIDAETNCTPFEECLQVIKGWSDDHPGHAPIFVMVEPKNQNIVLEPLFTDFDGPALRRLDDAVNAVFRPGDILTPDEVRGDADTLRDAVVDRGWPTLESARGKTVLVLNTGDPERALYLEGRESLEGAPMFVTAEEDAPAAAIVKVDDPDEARIQRLVRKHFIVRTRADADVIEPRANDVARRDLALRSGAQIVSTDFPVPDPTINAEYSVQIPDGKPGRCNPVAAPKDCRPVDVENPEHLAKRR
ncbi:MAG TPA: Ca2+-dependent phosphoinositide-specific phospholipase C [Acidimicrobiia bacterium]|nr:Ca2+-dependent phosphoinositide-specific phospholipase C [Acidimicrobiia bacterium]